ncbi:hypothetical protein KBY31_10025 [Ruegeria pomeroyi]|nr:hypothetical protein [Ruegeria pomeroyi]
MRHATVLALVISAGICLSAAALADQSRSDKVRRHPTIGQFDPLIWAETALGNRVDLSMGALPDGNRNGPLALSAALPFAETGDLRFSLVGALAWDAEMARSSRYSIGAVAPVAALEARYRSAYLRAVPSESLASDARLNFGLTIPLK